MKYYLVAYRETHELGVASHNIQLVQLDMPEEVRRTNQKSVVDTAEAHQNQVHCGLLKIHIIFYLQ